MLEKNVQNQMGAKDYKLRSTQKSAMQEEHGTTNQGKKANTCLDSSLCRMKDYRLVKEVMFGRMEGESRRGRLCREWLGDIKEWGEEEIQILIRVVARGEWWCVRHWTSTGNDR